MNSRAHVEGLRPATSRAFPAVARRAVLAVAATLACSIVPTATATATDTVTLYVPALQSARPGLGFAVSAVIGLQVWQTLRKAPSPNPRGLAFGEGVVIWDPTSAGVTSHDAADAAARKADVGAQLVLWGEAYEFGDDVVVQLNLTLPRYHDFREQTPEIWRFGWRGGATTLETDLPSRRYAFEPIVLDRALVERYSRPDAIALHERPDGGAERGRLGSRFLALRSERDAVYVRSAQGQEGWVRLPELAANRSEAVEFVSAMLRIYRADWDGARALLDKVVAAPTTPTAVRVDAALLRARAGLLAGLPAAAMFAEMDRAAALSPHARRGVLYAAAARIHPGKAMQSCPSAADLAALRHWMEGRTDVFRTDDDWLAQWRHSLQAGRDGCD